MKLIKNLVVFAIFFIGFVILAKTVGALLWGVIKVVFFVMGAIWLLKILLGDDEDEKKTSIWSRR